MGEAVVRIGIVMGSQSDWAVMQRGLGNPRRARGGA